MTVALVVITPPAISPVSLALAKKYLRIDTFDDDDVVNQAIAAATAHIDGPMGWLGRALMTQTLELRLPRFPHLPWSRSVSLPCAPVQSVTSVKYDDPTGAEQIVDSALYKSLGSERSRLACAVGAAWPATQGGFEGEDVESVRVRYVAGYGDIAGDVPPQIISALLMLIAQWYEIRPATIAENSIPYEMPNGVEALLAPFRLY